MRSVQRNPWYSGPVWIFPAKARPFSAKHPGSWWRCGPAPASTAFGRIRCGWNWTGPGRNTVQNRGRESSEERPRSQSLPLETRDGPPNWSSDGIRGSNDDGLKSDNRYAFSFHENFLIIFDSKMLWKYDWDEKSLERCKASYGKVMRVRASAALVDSTKEGLSCRKIGECEESDDMWRWEHCRVRYCHGIVMTWIPGLQLSGVTQWRAGGERCLYGTAAYYINRNNISHPFFEKRLFPTVGKNWLTILASTRLASWMRFCICGGGVEARQNRAHKNRARFLCWRICNSFNFVQFFQDFCQKSIQTQFDSFQIFHLRHYVVFFTW